eukprot:g21409.t1
MESSTEDNYWVGFDLGGTKMLTSVFDANLKQLVRKRKRTRAYEGLESGLDRIKQLIRSALKEAGIEASQLSGIGIACPGPLNLDEGIIIEAPNLSWVNVPIVKELEDEFGCRAIVANDVDLGVFAETVSGSAKSARCAFGIFPGTGIGGGCVYEGKILRGSVHSCMEIGHVRVIPDGPVCGCGLTGCLESVASRLAIASAAGAAAHRGQAPYLLDKVGTEITEIRSGALAASIQAGDRAVEQIVRRAAEHIGVAVASVIHLLAPDVVVLGGGMVEAMPKLFRETIDRVAKANVLSAYAKSFRVVIAEMGDDAGLFGAAAWARESSIRPLEHLAQAVHLGKDTFTRGAILKSTIEDCVRILKSYRQILAEYGITQADQVRVVATSAVREAMNRLAFLDRIFSATGFVVEPIDEAEVNRITYLSTQPQLIEDSAVSNSPAVIVEVGGGNTELLIVDGSDVVFAHTYRLGSIRLREVLGQYQAPRVNLRRIMENHIERTIEEIVEHVPDGNVEFIALGGDVRFAATQLLPAWDVQSLGRLPVGTFREFTDKMLALSDDELVQKYQLTYPDAETLGPALLADLKFAEALGVETVLVSNVNLRDGLLQEFAGRALWSEDFSKQIIRSALGLGRKFGFDESHALHVAELSRTLYRELADEHQLDSRFELILYVAALLHEIGQFIGAAGYHKHSMYIIRNSELFGLGKADLLLVSLVARYHRRASPKPGHEGFNSLERNQRIAVAKLSALLRVADALDHSHSRRVNEIHCEQEKSTLVISIPNVDDLSLEQLALRQKGGLFEEIFGMKVLLRTVRN